MQLASEFSDTVIFEEKECSIPFRSSFGMFEKAGDVGKQ
jgi:hypothetical protein